MNEVRQSTDGKCEAILARNAGRVYRTAYLRVGNRHDAEDIMQDVFVRYMRRSPVFQSAEHEKAWFLRCTVNLTKSFFTSARKRREVPLDEDIPSGTSADERAIAVREAVMKLPEAQRTAIHLFYFEDLSTAEIAKVAGKSEPAVRMTLSRARAALKDILGEDFDKE